MIHMRIPFYLAFFSTLVGCSTLSPYIEPVPSQDTARLRVVVQAGVNASVVAYPNQDGFCFDTSSKEGKELKVHLNTTGWDGFATKKIGMPFVNDHSKLFGTEFYVSSKDPITFTTYASANTGVSRISCSSAFKFQFQAGKDYQITLLPDFSTCTSGLSDITNFKSGDKLETIKTDPIFVKGSPAWKLLCKTSN